MSEEWRAYTTDPRTVCKYGIKCYQKNPDHHKKFKHPPQRKGKETAKRNNSRFNPYDKVSKVSKKKIELEVENISKTQKPSETEDTSDSESTEADKPVVEDATETKMNFENKEISIAAECSNTENPSKIQDIKFDAIEENARAKIKNVVDNTPEPTLNSQNDSESDEKGCNFSYYHKHTDPQVLHELFLVEMPKDFFTFFECLESEFKKVEDILSPVNLQLIGPFDFLLGKMPKLLCKDMYLNHWRFFYDPPEFQSVLKKKGKSEFHIGYFRDDPKEKPVFLAKNDSAKDCILTPIAENIFGAVYWYLQDQKKSSPFVAMACQKLMEKVKVWAEKYNYSIEEYNMKARLKQVVCRAFHGAGIVVPYDKKTQLGYRPLVEKDGKIKDMFKRLKEAKTQEQKDKVLAELQPVITYANIAMDECDFGTGLEAGIALFCSGLKELRNSAQKMLENAYSLLGRHEFKKIIQVHMESRRKGASVSAY